MRKFEVQTIKTANVIMETEDLAIPWLGIDTLASVKRNAKVRPSSDPSLQIQQYVITQAQGIKGHKCLYLRLRYKPERPKRESW